jgi:hypothetical protein
MCSSGRILQGGRAVASVGPGIRSEPAYGGSPDGLQCFGQGNWDRFKRGLQDLPESIVVGSGFWFIRRWDATAFMDALGRVCDTLSPGPDWGSVASRIGRLIPWEFDYKYDEAINRGATRFPE